MLDDGRVGPVLRVKAGILTVQEVASGYGMPVALVESAVRNKHLRKVVPRGQPSNRPKIYFVSKEDADEWIRGGTAMGLA